MMMMSIFDKTPEISEREQKKRFKDTSARKDTSGLYLGSMSTETTSCPFSLHGLSKRVLIRVLAQASSAIQALSFCGGKTQQERFLCPWWADHCGVIAPAWFWEFYPAPLGIEYHVFRRAVI